jgi:hypothetical protein
MEFAVSSVHADMYPIVAPLELRAGIGLFSPLNLFCTDGWSGWFCNIGFQMRGPASVFTAELAAILMAMDYYRK